MSLRDVDRVLQVMAWFHQHRDHLNPLLARNAQARCEMDDDDEDEEEEEEDDEEMDEVTLHVSYI